MIKNVCIACCRTQTFFPEKMQEIPLEIGFSRALNVVLCCFITLSECYRKAKRAKSLSGKEFIPLMPPTQSKYKEDV